MAVPDWRSRLRSLADQHKTCYGSGDFSRFDVIGVGELSSRGSRSASSATVDDHERLREIGSEMISEHGGVTGDVRDLTNDPKNNGVDKKTAAERMKQKREEALAKAASVVNDAFDKSEQYIARLPEDYQDRAVDIWELISYGIMSFWKMAWDAIIQIVDAVVNWVIMVWETVQECWENVRNAFEAAWAWFRALSLRVAPVCDASRVLVGVH